MKEWILRRVQNDRQLLAGTYLSVRRLSVKLRGDHALDLPLRGLLMDAMTPEKYHARIVEAFRRAREDQAAIRRSTFRLVVNRGITPLERARRSPLRRKG